MKTPIKELIIVISLAIVPVHTTQGAQIPLQAEQAANLDIRTSVATPAQQVSATSLHARVTLPPGAETLVGPLFSGTIATLHVAGGESLHRGQLLAQIRSPDFLALQRDLIGAQSAYALADAQLNRVRQLHEDGVVAMRRLQEAQASAERARADLRTQRGLLRSAGMDDAGINAIERTGEMATTLSLRAPRDGVVLQVTAGTGAHLDAMEPLVRMADLQEKWLRIALPVREMNHVREGDRLSLEAQSTDVHAVVLNVGSHVAGDTQTVEVRARITAGADRVAPGQFVEARLSREDAAPIWQVPTAALVRQGKASWLFVAVQGGFDLLPVQLHGQPDSSAQVAGDITAQTRIAISGIAALRALWPEGAGAVE